LFEARKRYGLSILNYVVTSNHIHLLVVDGEGDIVAKSLQLIAGRTAQEFNRRKGRKGAFWEDRYHATAIGSGKHLHRCLVYIDMNMVRAGAVAHPSEWQHSGYREIQSPPCRYRLIDRDRLIKLTGASDDEQLRLLHREWIDEALGSGRNPREPEWTEAIAVGGKEYVAIMKEKMGMRVPGRRIEQVEDKHVLREPETFYVADFGEKKSTLSQDNIPFCLYNCYVPNQIREQ